MKKKSYLVAVKDTSTGKILPGKVLGRFRKLEFAEKAFYSLAIRECGHSRTWHCGIFDAETKKLF
jgi:hypothetical protein